MQNEKQKTRNTVSPLKKLFPRTAVQSDRHGSADSGVGRLRVDAADVAAGGDLKVAVVSPAGSPRVLHLERVAVVAHGQNSVVKVGAATARENAAGVQLEGHLVGPC